MVKFASSHVHVFVQFQDFYSHLVILLVTYCIAISAKERFGQASDMENLIHSTCKYSIVLRLTFQFLKTAGPFFMSFRKNEI